MQKLKTMMMMVVAAAAFGVAADVVPSPIFCDHAVLQRSAATPIFGQADPGEKVKVEFAGIHGETVANPDGLWRVNLDLSSLSATPETLTIVGKNRIERTDVVVGEVWLASGQSNMAFTLERAGDARAKAAIAASTNPNLRLFNVKRTPELDPVRQLSGTWETATPETTAPFSAVGYFFGRELQKELKTPVGIINSSVGGTPVEAWTSPEATRSNPEMEQQRQTRITAFRNYGNIKDKYLAAFTAWQKQFNRTDRKFAGIPTGGSWKSIKMPGSIPGNGGAVWLRKKIKFSIVSTSLNFGKNLAPLWIYWNGEKVAHYNFSRQLENPYNSVKPPKSAVAGEEAEIMVRVFFDEKCPRIFDASLAPGIAGNWEYLYEYEFPPLTAQERAAMPPRLNHKMRKQLLPTALFNGMIYPFTPYALRGVIWYQGESNAKSDRSAREYEKKFKLMISDWRKQFENPDLPFYFCQLANYQPKSADPGTTGFWPRLRDSQLKTLAVPHTGMAVLIDAGEASDIHPLDKLTVGRRLALHALRNEYRRTDLTVNGPLPEGVVFSGGTAVVSFKPGTGPLAAGKLPDTYVQTARRKRYAKLVRNSPDSELEGFALAGNDGKWFWADAKIVGDTVVVTAKQVPAPVAVRYAWQNNPTCNLYNRAGLPASPFELR